MHRSGRTRTARPGAGANELLLEREPKAIEKGTASSSVLAVVTMVMSMPRWRSMESKSISGKMSCSVTPMEKLPRPVEAIGRDTAEVADTGDRHSGETVEELPHAVAAQGDLGTDRHAGAQAEGRDGLAGAGDHRLLAGDGTQVAHGTVDGLGIGGGLADAHVHDDLLDLRDHHDVLVLELLLKLALHLVEVLGLKTGQCTSLQPCSPPLGFKHGAWPLPDAKIGQRKFRIRSGCPRASCRHRTALAVAARQITDRSRAIRSL